MRQDETTKGAKINQTRIDSGKSTIVVESVFLTKTKHYRYNTDMFKQMVSFFPKTADGRQPGSCIVFLVCVFNMYYISIDTCLSVYMYVACLQKVSIPC